MTRTATPRSPNRLMPSGMAASIATAIAVGATLLVAAAHASDAKADAPAASPEMVAHGKYMVTIAGCNDCHTPWKMGEQGPEPDMDRMLSGHPSAMALPPPPKLSEPWITTSAATNTAWAGRWGISYTANLTPDDATGLGLWTLRNFRETLRTGKHMGRGRNILPPMPWPMYKHFTDADIEAIYSYLRTIPAVDNKVPVPVPPAG